MDEHATTMFSDHAIGFILVRRTVIEPMERVIEDMADQFLASRLVVASLTDKLPKLSTELAASRLEAQEWRAGLGTRYWYWLEPFPRVAPAFYAAGV